MPDLIAAAEKTEDGTSYPAAAFAYVPDPAQPSTWKLRLWESPDKKVTARQVGMAVAALGKGFRGNRVQIPSKDLPAVKRKVRAAWKSVNPDSELPAALQSSEHELVLADIHARLTGEAADQFDGWLADSQKRARRSRPAMLPKPGSQPPGAPDRPAMHELTDTQARLLFSEDNPTDSLWVGWMLPPEVASQIVIPDGQAAESLHLTLVYLGKTQDFPVDAGARLNAAIAAVAYSVDEPEFTINGIARFAASDSSDGQDVLYATIDGNAVHCLRDTICNALYRVGLCEPDRGHPYVPHITLAYIPKGAPAPPVSIPNVMVEIEDITVTVNGQSLAYEIHTPAIGGTPLMAYAEDARLKFFNLADLAAQETGECQLFMEWSALSAGEAPVPTWIPVLPKPGSYAHPKFGNIVITTERNERFIRNFADRVYGQDIPIDTEHEPLSGVYGHLVELRLAEDGSVEGRADWNERGQTALAERRFKYVSPEWYNAWTDPLSGTTYSDVLIGLAMTKRPFFKDSALRPLAASERGLFAADLIDDTDGQIIVFNALAPTSAQTDHPVAGGTTVADKPTAAEAAPTAQSFAELQAANAALAARLAASEETVKAKDAAAAALAERVTAMENTARRQRFTELALGRTELATRAWFGETAAHVAVLEKLASAFGEDSDVFRSYITQQNAAAEAIGKGNLFKESGSSAQPGVAGIGGGSATEQAMAKASAMIAAESISLNTALGRVFASEPQLYSAYKRESSVRVGEK